VKIDKVNVNENPQAMRDSGLRRYPAMAYEEHKLSVIFLTKRRIRKFLNRIGN
jgi:hypothetical protein